LRFGRFAAVSAALLTVAGLSAKAAQTPVYTEAKRIAQIEAPFIGECSGLADSRRNPGIFWINNDSGDGAYLYAVDRQGKTKGVFLVRNAAANDWEDIAYGPGPDGKGDFLYIADIGDNFKRRTDVTVYRIKEPKIGTTVGTKEVPLLTEEPTIRRTFRYPDGAHNAEALLVHPKTGILYIVTKEESGVSGVYKFPAEPAEWWEQNTLTHVGTVTITGEQHPFADLITAGDISPDGKKVILQSYLRAYELRLPDIAKDFDEIWKTKINQIPLPALAQGESICYSADGKSIFTSSEKAPAPLYELKSR
jgi:hypothetical protein